MKNLLSVLLVFLIYACTDRTDRYVMQANLIEVYDGDFACFNYHRTEDNTNIDSLVRVFNTRKLSLDYVSINESDDTIFIPSDSKFNAFTINIESNCSIRIPSLMIYEGKKNGAAFKSHYYIPGDTISFHVRFIMESVNNYGQKWLQRTPTKELLSKSQIKMSIPRKGKDIDKIPSIIFNNDTAKANFKPVVIINLEKNKVVKVFNGDSITESLIQPKSKDCMIN